jgi:transcriptional regulator with XRE-family HTH domain
MPKGKVLHPVDKLIKAKNLNVNEFCRIIGISGQRWAKIRLNYTELSINKLLLISGVLGVNAVVLFNIFYRHSLSVPNVEEIDKETDKILTSLNLSNLDNS